MTVSGLSITFFIQKSEKSVEMYECVTHIQCPYKHVNF